MYTGVCVYRLTQTNLLPVTLLPLSCGALRPSDAAAAPSDPQNLSRLKPPPTQAPPTPPPPSELTKTRRFAPSKSEPPTRRFAPRPSTKSPKLNLRYRTTDLDTESSDLERDPSDLERVMSTSRSDFRYRTFDVRSSDVRVQRSMSHMGSLAS